MNTTTIQYTNNAFTKSLTLLTLLFVALTLLSTGVAAEGGHALIVDDEDDRYIDFEIAAEEAVDDRDGIDEDDREYAGVLWVSPEGDVVEDHLETSDSVVDTPLDTDNLPETANGHFAAIWRFEITGSSGDNWDAVLENGEWKFDLEWRDGELLWSDESGEGQEENTEIKDTFFSHIGDADGSLGEWVENNNQEETPGEQLDAVWSYLEIPGADEGSLTGTEGTFAVIAEDEDDVMGIIELGENHEEIDGLDPETDSNDEWATFIAVEGTGQLKANQVYETIQDAVDAASEGDTIKVASGVYEEVFEVDERITLVGAGVGESKLEPDAEDTLNCGGQDTIICITGNDVHIEGFTITGSEGIERGIKTYNNEEVSLSGLKIENIDGTGLDAFDSTGLDITNVEAVDNAAAGIFLKGMDIVVDSVTTASNAWGGIAVSNDGSYDEDESAVTVEGVNDLNDDVPLYIESEKEVGMLSFGYEEENSVTVPEEDFAFYIGGTPKDDLEQVLLMEDKGSATSVAQDAQEDHPHIENLFVRAIDVPELYVEEGLRIQDAVDVADEGSTIHVGEGTYEESVEIDTSEITLKGSGIGNTVLDAGGEQFGININEDLGEVTITGFTVDGWTVGGIGQGTASAEGTSPQIIENEVLAPDETTSHGNSIQVTGNNARVDGNVVEITLLVDESGEPHTEWDGTGILVYGGESTEVIDNTITGDNHDRAIGVSGGDEIGDIDTLPVRDILISENEIEGTGTGIDISKDVDGSKIENNVIVGTERAFIQSESEGFDNEIYEPGETVLTENVFESNDIQIAMYDMDDEFAFAGDLDLRPDNNFDRSVLIYESESDNDPKVPVMFSFIQDAVDEAGEGDIVKIDEGVYELEDTVKMDKHDIQLLAEGDVELRPAEDASFESTTPLIIEQAEGVTISGFEFTGFLTRDGANAISIRNSDEAVISDNLFAHGLAEADDTGEWTSTGVVVTDSESVEIRDNEFDISGASAIAANGNYFGEHFDLDWTEEGEIVEALIIENNVISADVGVELQEEVQSTSIQNNSFDSGKGIYTVQLDSNSPSGTVANLNDFSGSDVGVDATVHDSELDATRNYWGQPQGPEDSQVEGDDVDYTPWLPVPHAQQGVLEIAEENPSVTRGNTQSFSAVVRDGGEEYEVDDVEWSIVSDSAGSEIDGNAVTPGSQGSVDVVAEYVGDELELTVEEATVTLNSEGRTHVSSGTPGTLPDEAEAELPDEAEVDEGEEQEEETDEEETGTGEDATGDTTTDEGTTGDDTTGEQEEDPDTPTRLTGLFLADAPDFLVSLTESISNLLPF